MKAIALMSSYLEKKQPKFYKQTDKNNTEKDEKFKTA
jgi:hypothetical protein